MGIWVERACENINNNKWTKKQNEEEKKRVIERILFDVLGITDTIEC